MPPAGWRPPEATAAADPGDIEIGDWIGRYNRNVEFRQADILDMQWSILNEHGDIVSFPTIRLRSRLAKIFVVKLSNEMGWATDISPFWVLPVIFISQG